MDAVLFSVSAEWSATGVVGDRAHEDVLDALFNGQVQSFWTSGVYCACLSLLGMALRTNWLAAVTNSSVGPTSAEEADWTWVYMQYTVSGLTVIFNIFGVVLPMKLFAMKFGTGVCPRGSCVGKVWSLKFKGCKCYRGLKFGLLHWLCFLIPCSATALPVTIIVLHICRPVIVTGSACRSACICTKFVVNASETWALSTHTPVPAVCKSPTVIVTSSRFDVVSVC